MCIRDRLQRVRIVMREVVGHAGEASVHVSAAQFFGAHIYACLLYTSDAADERSSVDLGGRRIIKKKKTQ